MSNETRDKFLTEAMRECWHRYMGYGSICLICSDYRPSQGQNNNFSSWRGFGKLWEFAQQQEWWDDFCDYHFLTLHEENEEMITYLDLTILQPDKFADAVYTFLKESV